MRKLILLCFVLVGCIPYKDYLVNDDLCNFDDSIFKLKEEEKYFDIIKYRSAIDIALNTGDRCNLLDDEKLYVYIYAWADNKAITKTIQDKNTGIIKRIGYDSIGKIKSFSNHHVYNSDYLQDIIWYNSDGSIKKNEDCRKAGKYPICYREALAIVTRKKRRKDSITRLFKSKFNYRSKRYFVWKVFTKVPKRFGKGKSRCFNLDAQTGKILTKGIVVTVPAKFKD